MNSFAYVSVTNAGQAIEQWAANAGSAYLAGGTNLIDQMKLGIDRPQKLVDVNHLPLQKVEPLPDGGLRIGAMVRNSDLAYDQRIIKSYPLLSQAILSGASPQLRNVATTGGNLMQKTRCTYFRDGFSPCNKRQPGSGCAAIGGVNRGHAILGTTDKCIATHPSDMDVALVALAAVVQTQSSSGKRSIPISDFYVAYGQDPAKETVLEPGELITSVDLPAAAWFARSHYLKARDRASFEFALASAAVALDLDGSRIREARIALGGVAGKPWRATTAEAALKGATAGDDAFKAAAEAELKPALAQSHNAFKIPLAKRVMIRALQTVAAMA
jgi:xanthine dehydrogenase YagS FAD-binding subunit